MGDQDGFHEASDEREFIPTVTNFRVHSCPFAVRFGLIFVPFAAIQIGLLPAGVAAVDDEVASGKEAGGVGR
jgi:hypothetical protein